MNPNDAGSASMSRSVMALPGERRTSYDIGEGEEAGLE
jgi:hypothetical protein